jgi:predicted neutral ceramidase superfamily lipid hydrolase
VCVFGVKCEKYKIVVISGHIYIINYTVVATNLIVQFYPERFCGTFLLQIVLVFSLNIKEVGCFVYNADQLMRMAGG